MVLKKKTGQQELSKYCATVCQLFIWSQSLGRIQVRSLWMFTSNQTHSSQTCTKLYGLLRSPYTLKLISTDNLKALLLILEDSV